MISRRGFLAFGLLAPLTACRRCGRGGAGVKLQLNWVPEPELGGVYAADYTKAGLDVDIVPGTAGMPVVQLVAAGDADFGVAAGEDVIVARAQGADVVALYAIFQSSPQGVMVHAKKGMKSLADMHGGTLAIETGSPFGAFLKKHFDLAGVTLAPYDGGVARFLADPDYAQQCFVTSEPLEAKHEGSDPQIFTGKDLGFDPYANVIITSGALLKEKLGLAKAFVAATKAGWEAYLASPTETNARMAEMNGGMEEETFAEVSKAQEPLVRGDAPLGAMNAERWRKVAAQLVELGVIEAAPSAEECFTMEALG